MQKKALGTSVNLGGVTAACRARADRVGAAQFISDWVLRSQAAQGQLRCRAIKSHVKDFKLHCPFLGG